MIFTTYPHDCYHHGCQHHYCSPEEGGGFHGAAMYSKGIYRHIYHRIQWYTIGFNGIPSDPMVYHRTDGIPSDPMVYHRIQWYTIGSDGYGDVVGMSRDVWGCLNMVQTWFKQGIWKGIGGVYHHHPIIPIIWRRTPGPGPWAWAPGATLGPSHPRPKPP